VTLKGLDDEWKERQVESQTKASPAPVEHRAEKGDARQEKEFVIQ
jgi:hypothetical protein